jgi:ribosomal protein L37E
VKSWGWWENPPEPQPPPEPFPGADKCSGVIGPGSRRDVPFIPSLKRKTAAKKEKNLARFAAEKKRLCAERKALFKVWNRKLRETLGSHSNSHNGGGYETENCPRCGASIFVKRRRVCLDCGYTLGELHYTPRTKDLTSYMDLFGLPPIQEITRPSNQRRRRRLTAEQFVAGLILRGQFEKLTDAPSLEKASATYQILCEGWLPRDVAAFSNDSERAIAARAERLFDTATEHEAKGEPLPQPSTNEINDLKHHFAYLRNEILSLRSDLCIN